MNIELENKQLPVLLLTGYLGSGKTTLLNRILTNRRGIKFAVIVNDLGEVNIDADLIEKGGVVGQTDDSLVAQLEEISRMNRFDYIAIEASGICEPAPIAQTINSYPQLAKPSYPGVAIPTLDCIVTVVDALRMKDEFACGDALEKEDLGEEDLERLVIEQIEFCNIVLLNKAAEVTPEELGKVRSIVSAINPGATIYECNYGDIDLDKILNTGLFDFDKVATSAAWINEIEGHHDEDEEDDDHDDDHEEHGHHHHHHHHDDEGEAEEYGIGTYVYYSRPPLNFNKFDYMVAKKWPEGIIRAKGLCYFDDEPDKCYLFEQAGRQKTIKEAGLWFATMPENQLERMLERDENLRRDWDPQYGDRMIKIVFIGQHLDRAAIDQFMKASCS